jgi:hypothetical protein
VVEGERLCCLVESDYGLLCDERFRGNGWCGDEAKLIPRNGSNDAAISATSADECRRSNHQPSTNSVDWKFFE